jgi:hypothetical protein
MRDRVKSQSNEDKSWQSHIGIRGIFQAIGLKSAKDVMKRQPKLWSEK